MAALTFLACSAIHQLYELTDAFVRCGFNFNKGFRYFQARRRLQLFRHYCRELWLLEAATLNRSEIDYASTRSSEKQVKDSKVTLVKLQRNNMDFATIEAAAMASEHYEVVQRRRNTDDGSISFDMLENPDDIEVLSGLEVDTAFYEFVDTVPVYHNSRLGILREGVSFTFTGHILANCERFSINFINNNDTQDIVLHINPRLPQNYIVRNSRVRNVWGREEVSSALPFSLQRGSNFTIQVLLTDSSYMISVNGHHFAKYLHRLPYGMVTSVEVKGDVEDVNLERCNAIEYPDRLPESEPKDIRLSLGLSPTTNDDSGLDEGDFDELDGTNIPREWRLIHMRSTIVPPSPSLQSNTGLLLPFYGKLPAGTLIPGRCLKIEGRVKLLPHSFYINLQQGQHIWPHPLIALHFNPRFSKNMGAIGKSIVCRNAWLDGDWAQEERSELHTDFRPGKTFSMAIVCGTEAFEIYVNRKLLTEFKYRLKPDIIDTVYIQGDIKLWDVMLENTVSMNGKKRIYQNPAYTDEY